jgi:hypothetical protein
MKLRCDFCKYNKEEFCVKLDEELLNNFAKLYFGGAVGVYAGNIVNDSICGIEVKAKRRDDFIAFQALAPTEEEKAICPTQ